MKSFFLVFLLIFSLAGFGQQDTCRCCDPVHKAFDFWLGNWEVYNPEGVLVGKNTITREEGGCLVRESYSSTTNTFTGSSFNYYNGATGLWEQHWIDNQGASLNLSGSPVNKGMVLQGDHGDGEARRTDRISWTLLDDGRVRQLWEQRKPGREWVVIFDGYYSKLDEEG